MVFAPWPEWAPEWHRHGLAGYVAIELNSYWHREYADKYKRPPLGQPYTNPTVTPLWFKKR